jgi:hypothetical protein
MHLLLDVKEPLGEGKENVKTREGKRK